MKKNNKDDKISKRQITFLILLIAISFYVTLNGFGEDQMVSRIISYCVGYCFAVFLYSLSIKDKPKSKNE